MPGLVEWNQVNADFGKSAVARKLKKQGALWSIGEDIDGQYTARILSSGSRINLGALQKQTNIKLELVK